MAVTSVQPCVEAPTVRVPDTPEDVCFAATTAAPMLERCEETQRLRSLSRPSSVPRASDGRVEQARNVRVVGAGHGPRRHAAGGKTLEVRRFRELARGDRERPGADEHSERALETCDGMTTKTAGTTRRARALLRPFTGPAGVVPLPGHRNPSGTQRQETAGSGNRFGTSFRETSRRASERDERPPGPGRKKALKGKPDERQSPENGDTAR